ncbi:MAG: HD domain-containing protein [Anaerolineae bacterium]
MRVRYRLGQFWRILTAVPLDKSARIAVTAVLTPTELALFEYFAASDQWHSFHVMRLLQSTGHEDPDLIKAALLHDVGKAGKRLTIWERSLIVLAGFFLPGQTAVWGQGEARGWRRPFVIKAQHPEWGADMAAKAGCSPRTASLIRRHQDLLPETAVTEEDKLLCLLQWADDRS